MADDLMPCPFCGGEARIESYYAGHRAIECGQCSASVLVHDLAMAIAAWNRRAAPSSPVADDGLPKWIDNEKGKDPLMDDMIGYIIGLRARHIEQVRQVQREAYEAGVKAGKENR